MEQHEPQRSRQLTQTKPPKYAKIFPNGDPITEPFLQKLIEIRQRKNPNDSLVWPDRNRCPYCGSDNELKEIAIKKEPGIVSITVICADECIPEKYLQ